LQIESVSTLAVTQGPEEGVYLSGVLRARRVAKYRNRISGPILDRIDIDLEVSRVPIAKLTSLNSGEMPAVIQERVEAARTRQAARFAVLGKPHMLVNGDMGPDEVQRFCGLDEARRGLLRNAAV
jgi:magnesium chelatase family protein